MLQQNANKLGDAPAIAYRDQSQTWREADQEANRWAHFFLSCDIRAGDVVALMMDNRPAYLHALVGLNRIGAIAACINTHATGPALIHAINIAGARLVLVGAEHAPAIWDVEDSLKLDNPTRRICLHAETDDVADTGAVRGVTRRRGDANVINEEIESAPIVPPPMMPTARGDEAMAYLYTSGTTGLPKAATVTNARFMMAALGFGHMLHEATHEDVIYVALPLYHGNAQWGGWGAALATGATLALRRKFSASGFWSDAHKFGATRFMYIGELCRYLLNQPRKPDDRTHRIRIAVGNGLRGDIWKSFQDRFAIPLIREFYGATEGNAPMFNLEGRPGMIGRLSYGQALVQCDPSSGEPIRDAAGRLTKIRKPGQTGLLVGKISNITRFDGYVDQRDTETKTLRNVFRRGDAYFNSGDLLTLHEDDWVSFSDRVGDTYRWKGENISTNEVAEILNRARGVLESNVYGVAIPGTEGRVGMATLRTNDQFNLPEFTHHVVTNLPLYQRPYFLRLSKEMRVTSTLKHQKVDYRSEGYDPSRIKDVLYFLERERYIPLTVELYDRIQSADIAL